MKSFVIAPCVNQRYAVTSHFPKYCLAMLHLSLVAKRSSYLKFSHPHFASRTSDNSDIISFKGKMFVQNTKHNISWGILLANKFREII